MLLAKPLQAVVCATLFTLGCSSSGNGNDGEGGYAGWDGGTGADGGGGTAANPLPLKIVTWNVHNLVNDLADGDVSQESVESPADYLAHREAVGRVLAQIDADIVVLQEVEHRPVLQDLNTYELQDRYSELHVTTGNDPRGVDVGLLAKVPIEEVVFHKDESFPVLGTPAPTYQYARDCLEARLTFNGRRLALYGVHYKAKEDDDPDKRLAEAQHTKGLADAYRHANPGAAALILGDFNDVPGSLPYTQTLGSPPDNYVNAADYVPQADRWTMLYQGNYELVDQQMMSAELAPLLDQASAAIWHNADVDEASDHAPHIATYNVR